MVCCLDNTMEHHGHACGAKKWDKYNRTCLKIFFVQGAQHTRQSPREHRGLEYLEMKLQKRCLATIESLAQTLYIVSCARANAWNTARQNAKVYARKNARQNVRLCQKECQIECQSMPERMPNRMSEYMSFPISNIVSQCQLLGHVLTSVNQISKGASPAGVWNCCAMIPAFVVQWSLLLVWPQTFISTMCLKCNFSPTLASMHGNEALKLIPCHKKWKNNTRMSAWRLFQMASRGAPTWTESFQHVSHFQPKRFRFSTSPIPGLQYLSKTSPISGLKYLSNIWAEIPLQYYVIPCVSGGTHAPKLNPSIPSTFFEPANAVSGRVVAAGLLKAHLGWVAGKNLAAHSAFSNISPIAVLAHLQ